MFSLLSTCEIHIARTTFFSNQNPTDKTKPTLHFRLPCNKWNFALLFLEYTGVLSKSKHGLRAGPAIQKLCLHSLGHISIHVADNEQNTNSTDQEIVGFETKRWRWVAECVRRCGRVVGRWLHYFPLHSIFIDASIRLPIFRYCRNETEAKKVCGHVGVVGPHSSASAGCYYILLGIKMTSCIRSPQRFARVELVSLCRRFAFLVGVFCGPITRS